MKVEPLSDDESRELLATHEVGRLAVVVGGYPEIFPVNYAVVRDRVVIRTDPGAKLSHRGSSEFASKSTSWTWLAEPAGACS